MHLIKLWLAALAVLLAAAQARTEGVVLDCSEEELQATLAGGGLVVFEDDCSISLSNTIVITEETILDAGGFEVTLSGEGLIRLITVEPGARLTLVGLTLTDGAVTNVGGGALFIGTGAEVIASNCVFSFNNATGPDGPDGRNGHNSDGTGSDGEAAGHGISVRGGAVYNTGYFNAYRCQFTTNNAFGGNGGAGGAGGTGGFTGGNGGRGGNGGDAAGGAIYSTGTLLLSECAFAGNASGGGHAGPGGAGGGGPFTGFPASGGSGGSGSGGGLYSVGESTTVLASTFEANAAQGGHSENGGMQASRAGADGPDGGNSAGGAVYADGSLSISNSTFFANDALGGNGGDGGPGQFTGGDGGDGGAAAGGGVTGRGDKTVVNCTFLENSATGGTNGVAGSGPFPGENGSRGNSRGGNVANVAGTFLLANTILGTNSFAGKAGYGTFIDGGHNLSADTSVKLGETSKVDQKKLGLGTLGNYGGPTRTISLLTNSPAIDAALDEAAPETDQRGLPRPVGEHADIGAYETSFSLSGRVRVGTTGLPGVIITVNDEWFTETDNSGNYSLPVADGEIAIVPDLEGYEFSPESISLVVTGNTSGVNFTATRVFSLRGRILEASNGVPGITVQIGTNTLTTSANGSFALPVVAGTYTVTPTNACFRFDPTNRTVVVSATNSNRADFTAIREALVLNGTVTVGTNPLPGVMIQAGPISTLTDTNGEFAVSNLCRGAYVVVPSLAGYTFTPSQHDAILPGANKLLFSATAGFSASGVVYEGEFPLDGTSVLLRGGGATNWTLSTNGGAFTFQGLRSGTPYLVEPSRAGYRFVPPAWSFTLASDTNAGFLALPLPAIAPAQDGSISLSFAANTGRVYRVESSTNLVDWQTILTNTTPFLFQDTNTSVQPARFYRLR